MIWVWCLLQMPEIPVPLFYKHNKSLLTSYLKMFKHSVIGFALKHLKREKWKCWLLSRVWLLGTLCSVVCQAPLPMEFSRQEYWSGLPFPSLGDLPDQGIKGRFPVLRANSLPSESPGKPQLCLTSLTKK